MREERPLFIEENWGTKASQRVADFVEQNHEWILCNQGNGEQGKTHVGSKEKLGAAASSLEACKTSACACVGA